MCRVAQEKNARCGYDALGRRILRYTAVDGKVVYERYFYDGADVIADYDGRTGEVRALYVTPFLDENLLKEDYTGPEPLLAWYTQDGLGSVRQLVVGDTVLNSYTYTAWGVPLSWHETISNRYTFTSREYNPETRDYYYRARHYSPFRSRFASRDISAKNAYLYTENNPVAFRDPTGFQQERGRNILERLNTNIVVSHRSRRRVVTETTIWTTTNFSLRFGGLGEWQALKNKTSGFLQIVRWNIRIQLCRMKPALQTRLFSIRSPWLVDSSKVGDPYDYNALLFSKEKKMLRYLDTPGLICAFPPNAKLLYYRIVFQARIYWCLRRGNICRAVAVLKWGFEYIFRNKGWIVLVLQPCDQEWTDKRFKAAARNISPNAMKHAITWNRNVFAPWIEGV